MKSKGVDLTSFTNSLAGLTDEVLAGFLADLPSEWSDESLPKIKEHLCAIRDHGAEFAEAVRRFLA